MQLSLGKKIAGLAVAGAVLVGAGTMAWADSSSSPSSTQAAATAGTGATAGSSPSSTSPKAGRKQGGLLRRADHGTIEVKAKDSTGTATWQTFTFDRGAVSAATASQITLARPDGQSATLTINASTNFQGVTSWQQIATSKPALVVSENGVATVIRQAVNATPSTSGPSTGSTTTPAA